MTDTQKTATWIRTLKGWRGDAALYRCDPPLEGEEYVIASAIVSMFSGPETYLFPASKDATDAPTSWMEMAASQRGTLSHNAVFNDAGYQVVREQVSNDSHL